MIALNAKYELRLILVLLSIFFADCSNKNTRRSRIAIIGGGIGGTATAYELSKLAAKDGHDISLDLYEAAEIGGRLATTKINGYEFETGGSIIHVENKKMIDYVESNGLHWYNEPPGYVSEDVTGLYNGEEFVYISSDSYMWNVIRLMWRYGLDILTFESALVEPLLSDFERIYEAQEKQIQFDDVHSLLGYMRHYFPVLMEVKFNEYLQAQQFGYNFINEFIFLATNNYNQNTDIPVFVGLHWYNEPPGYVSEDVTGLYNGEEFVYISSDSYMWNVIRLMWRYGLDILTFESALVEPLLSDFERIYEAQEKQIQFDDVHSLLGYMRHYFPVLMEVKFNEYLQAQQFGYNFINEFIFLATNNYNQNTDIPVFVGSLSLAGAQAFSHRRVGGGNKRVPETLLVQSDARLIKARVESVTLRPDSTFALAVNNASHVYDYVVIACPIIENSKNKIQFEGFPELNIPLIKYQKTVVTLVHGELNHTFFHYDSPEGLPNNIYAVNDDLFYNSVCVENPVTFDPQYDNKVFKVFSKDILTDEQLDLLFRTRNDVTFVPWLAYPLYDTESRNLSFVLHNNLFYVNAIEWAASTMEMSAISGVNVALHIHKILGN